MPIPSVSEGGSFLFTLFHLFVYRPLTFTHLPELSHSVTIVNNHKLLFSLLIASVYPLHASAQTHADAKIFSVHCKTSSVSPNRNSPAHQNSAAHHSIPPFSKPQRRPSAPPAHSTKFAILSPGQWRVAVNSGRESVSFRRCGFDNFPFASDSEIRSFITAQVPLYDGFAPMHGNMLDKSPPRSNLWQKSKGIATVSHLPYKLGNGDSNIFSNFPAPRSKLLASRFTGTQAIPNPSCFVKAAPRARLFGGNLPRNFPRTRLFLIIANAIF